MERKVSDMKLLKRFWMEEDGIGVVEIVLILVILVALIVIFKDKITTIISNAFSQIDDGAGTINDGISI
jgi:Flp pilus assembly pilin Flp